MSEQEPVPPIPAIPGHAADSPTDLWNRSLDRTLLQDWLSKQNHLDMPRTHYFAVLAGVYQDHDAAQKAIRALLPDPWTCAPNSWQEPLAKLVQDIREDPKIVGELKGDALAGGWRAALNLFAYRTGKAAFLNSRSLPLVLDHYYKILFKLIQERIQSTKNQRERDQVSIPALPSDPLTWLETDLKDLVAAAKHHPQELARIWHAQTHSARRTVLVEYAGTVRRRIGAAMPHIYLTAATAYIDQHQPDKHFQRRHLGPLRRALRVAGAVETIQAALKHTV